MGIIYACVRLHLHTQMRYEDPLPLTFGQLWHIFSALLEPQGVLTTEEKRQCPAKSVETIDNSSRGTKPLRLTTRSPRDHI